MRRFSCLLVAGLLAACSSQDESKEGTTEQDAGVLSGADAGGPSTPDASQRTTADVGPTEFRCPVSMVSEGTACTKEEAICEYSAALTCPVGCSGGDYHGYQCSKGRWVDYRHTMGAPRCQCKALDFPSGLQGTWRFYEAGTPQAYAWVRFSALGNTLSDSGAPGQGSIEILPGPAATTDNIPWGNCGGEGLWFITARPLAFEVRPPAGCAGASASEIYTLTSREEALPPSLPGCLLHITMDSVSGAHFEACKYPDTQCDAAMKTCYAP